MYQTILDDKRTKRATQKVQKEINWYWILMIVDIDRIRIQWDLIVDLFCLSRCVSLCMCLRGIFFLNQMSSFHFDKQDSSSLILLKSTFFQKQNFESWSFAQQSNYLREYHKKFCWTMHSLLGLKRFFSQSFTFEIRIF